MVARRCLWLLLACLLCAAPAWAADVDVQASLDRTAISMGEQAQLTVQVSGAQTQEAPQLPPLPDFEVMSAGQSTNVTIVNGQMSSNSGYMYVLVPRKAGHFTIPRIAVRVGGHLYQTASLELEVEAASAAPQQPPQQPPIGPPGFPQPPFGIPRPGIHFRNPPGNSRLPSDLNPLYLTGSVDHKVAYPGQKVTYTFRFYRLAQVTIAGSPRYTPPDTTGFVTEDQRPQRSFQEMVKGHEYAVTELRTSLYPTAPGTFDVGAAKLTCRVADLYPSLDGDDAMQLMQQLSLGEERELTAPAVPVEVRPLPSAGRPPSFSGAVGHFKMEAHLDRAQANVGQAVNLVMTVTGDGNLSLATPPKLPALDGFKMYDTVSSGKEPGQRTYTTVLVPTAPGARRLDDVRYSYYDPDAGHYVEVKAPAMQLAVSGTAAVAATASPTAGATAPPTAAAPAPDALRYIHSEAMGRPPVELLVSRWFWAAQTLPVLLVLGTLGAGWWQRWRTAAPSLERRRQRALRRARTQLDKRGVAQAPAVLHEFLEDRLAVHTAGLSLRELDSLLSERGTPPEVRQRLRTVLESADASRYAGAPAVAQGDVAELLGGLEAALK